MIEHRNVTVSIDGPNLSGTIHHKYTGPAALVILGAEKKGRTYDYVAIDSMTCVNMTPGTVTINTEA